MNTKRIVIIGLSAALIFAGTFIHIPLPFLGPNSMLHLGTTVIYICAVLLGPDTGLSAGIGCALFDLLQMPIYAGPTFIIKGLQGYVSGKIAFAGKKEGNSLIQNIIGFILGAVISLAGYFITDYYIVYHNWMTSLTSTIGSLLTSGIGIVFSLIIVSAIKPIFKRANNRL